MNIKDNFCLNSHLLTAITSYPIQQNWKCLHIRNHQYTEFHLLNFWGCRSLGRKPRFVLVRWDLTFKQILITKPKNSSSTQSEL